MKKIKKYKVGVVFTTNGYGSCTLPGRHVPADIRSGPRVRESVDGLFVGRDGDGVLVVRVARGRSRPVSRRNGLEHGGSTGTAAARGSNQTRSSATEHARNGSDTAASMGRPGERCERETCGANGVCGAFGGTIMERVANDGGRCGHTSDAVPAANECAAAGTRMGNAPPRTSLARDNAP